VRQYAESLFLKREVFATAERTGILLFVSLFEGQAVLLPDRGLAGPRPGDAVGSSGGPMVASLSRDRPGEALERGRAGLLGVLEGARSPVPGTQMKCPMRSSREERMKRASFPDFLAVTSLSSRTVIAADVPYLTAG
jgi:hypothetical protein